MKNNEVITLKVNLETKKQLQEIGKEKEWTISHTARFLIERSLKELQVQAQKKGSADALKE